MAATSVTVPRTPILPEAGPSNPGTEMNAMAMVPVGTVAPRLNLAQWGQRRITWGKKHIGSTYYQTMLDSGYVEWSRKRYNSLSVDQRDFVDYALAQMEFDATQQQRHP